MMQKEQFLQILKNYRKGHVSEEEKNFLLAYYNLFEVEPDILELLSPDEWNQLRSGLHKDIHQQIALHEQDSGVPVKRARPWIAIAASLALLLTVAGGVYFRAGRQSQQVPLSSADSHISPGGYKAVLTLSDGSQLVLDTMKNGSVLRQGFNRISKVEDGRLVYEQLEKQQNDESTGFNMIETPAGGHYEIILPDGSKAWLNAGSTLRYPVSFGNDYRRVEITGEVYFEVERNENKPFKVVVTRKAEEDGMEIEVLGTHFNVMAYEEETSVKTTLLEGAVKVSKGKGSQTIKTGQQAQVMNDGRIQIRDNANTEEAVAWKNGYFMFVNEDLQSVMRKIARWYNVDIEYRGEILPKVFGGTVSRFENVSEVLEMLELTGSVNFQIEGRRIIVMP